ncbi:MAG: hypothetical protein LBW77_00700, partial [Verrucomicrobiota bacterium]|nr:hypothetical protein [Verrucomicrobiota bacterium]
MSRPKEPVVSDAAWMEWKETCAADSCTPPHKAELMNAAANYLRNYTASADSRTVSDVKGMKKDAFRLIESHLYKKRTIFGKPFKDYLFTLQDGDCLGKRLTGILLKKMLFRDIVRSSSHTAPPVPFEDDETGEAIARELEDTNTPPADRAIVQEETFGLFF